MGRGVDPAPRLGVEHELHHLGARHAMRIPWRRTPSACSRVSGIPNLACASNGWLGLGAMDDRGVGTTRVS